MGYCHHCGVEITEQTGVCPACGKRLRFIWKKQYTLALAAVLLCAVIGVLAVLAVGNIGKQGFSQDTAAIAAAETSVVKVLCYDHEGKESATGSGFFLYDNKTVVTNYHVMQNAHTCRVSTMDDREYQVEYIWRYSKEQDIAILQLKDSADAQPLRCGDSEAIEKGAPVTAIGSPLGIKNTVSTGILSGRIQQDGLQILQFTAPISSGSSGGALFNENGEVIGVTFASYVDGQNLNLAIPIEEVETLYNKSSFISPVSDIYFTEHPYLEYVLAYPNVTEVTLEDLKAYPERYDGKYVILKAHISSIGPEYWSGDYSIYLTNERYVSGDFEVDDWENSRDVDFEQTCVLEMWMDVEDLEYVQYPREAGREITVLGRFNYTPKGSRILVSLAEYSEANLCAYVVYCEDAS